MSEFDVTFKAMGSDVRLLIGEPAPGVPEPEVAAERAQHFIAAFDAALSRFREESELCALNADERSAVPASELLRTAVAVGIWAAERSGGLVDPTLVREIVSVGYAESRAGVTGASLADALAAAPLRRPARPHPSQGWRKFEVDEEAGVIRRPPGLGFDSGGTGKGLAADLVAQELEGYSRFVVDCGGDIRIGGLDARHHPYEVLVEHPLSGRRAHVLHLGAGGVATSGLNVRIWRRQDGSFAHHLLDPASGEPVWTGLIGATALGRTALEAETLSKAALLSGPEGGREVLAERGGLLVHDSGRVELAGPLNVTPRLRFELPSNQANAPAIA
jgi:thiamine biosynthesis lipoprotein